MSDEEFYSLEEFLFNGCEWEKRRKCDSLYIERYNRVLKILIEATKYVESVEIVDKNELMNILKNN